MRKRWNEGMTKQAIDVSARESLQLMAKAAAPSEGELISCGQTAAMAVINKYVDAEKASNPGLPREVILQMAMHNSGCFCKVAHFILGKEQK
jgi:hypothetical protein